MFSSLIQRTYTGIIICTNHIEIFMSKSSEVVMIGSNLKNSRLEKQTKDLYGTIDLSDKNET